jgi:hypothetical protein
VLLLLGPPMIRENQYTFLASGPYCSGCIDILVLSLSGPQ